MPPINILESESERWILLRGTWHIIHVRRDFLLNSKELNSLSQRSLKVSLRSDVKLLDFFNQTQN